MAIKNFRVHNGIDVMGTDINLNQSVLIKEASGVLKVRNSSDTSDASITANTVTATSMTINGQTAATTDDATALAIALG